MLILNSCTNDLVIVRKILELNKYGIQDDGTTRSIDITGNVLGEYFTNIFESNTIFYPTRQLVLKMHTTNEKALFALSLSLSLSLCSAKWLNKVNIKQRKNHRTSFSDFHDLQF